MRVAKPFLRRIRGSLETRALVANFLPAAVVTIFVLALISIALIVHFRAVQSEIELRALSLAESLAIQAELPVFVGNRAELDRITQKTVTVESVLYASVETVEGKPISLAVRDGFTIAEIRPQAESDSAPTRSLSLISETPTIDIVLPVTTIAEAEFSDWETPAEQTRTLGRVRVGISVLQHEVLLRRGLWSMAALGIISLASILGVQFWQLRRILSPLKVLAKVTQSVAMGDLECRADIPGNDEVALLADAFNEMVEKVKVSRSQLLDAVEEAQSASRLKSQFLANMSHEIRTPMNGIIGLTEQVLDLQLPEDAREQLSLVSTSAHTLLHVLNDIVDLSRVESGRLQLERSPFDIGDEFEHVAKILAPQAHAKNVELVCLLPNSVPRLIGDAHRIRQILTNLVANAIKFTQTGHVAISLDASVTADHRCKLSCTITDTGIGIPTDKLDAIFEPFTQADGSFTRQYGGNGLGLAICKQLVTLMGGSIAVTSEPGRGSKFVVSLELHVEPSMEPCGECLAPRKSLVQHPVTVLLIAAAEFARTAHTTLLSCGAIRVLSARNASEALPLLHRSPGSEPPVAVVFIDSEFRGEDAFATARLVRENASGQFSIVMLSTSSEVAAITPETKKLHETKKLVDRILLKPLMRSEVADVILDALQASSGRLAKEAPTPTIPTPAPLASLSILLAEDNPVNQRVAAALVKSCGHRVKIVPDGKQAVQAWCDGEFDAVLMDVQMPNMDGLQATRTIRAEENGTARHTRIIALTAHALVGDRDMCLEAGMDDYLTKPIKRSDLERLLNSIGQPV